MSAPEIRPATSDDIHQIAHISSIVFLDNPLYAWLHPYRYEWLKDFHDWKLTIICSLFYDYQIKFFVLEACIPPNTEEKSIVGYVMLRKVYDEGREQDKVEMKQKMRERSWIDFFLHFYHCVIYQIDLFFKMSKSADYEAIHKMNAMAKKVYLFPYNIGPHFELMDLAVLPTFQRHGYGSLLLRHCLTIARQQNRKIALETTPTNRLFYEKNGFRQPFGSWSYVCWNEDPLAQGVGLVHDQTEESSPSPSKYTVNDEGTRSFQPIFSPHFESLGKSSIDDVTKNYEASEVMRKGPGERNEGRIGVELVEENREVEVAFDDVSLSPGREAGLRSRRGKGEREAKADEHGRSLPKSIDSPTSATGLVEDSDDGDEDEDDGGNNAASQKTKPATMDKAEKSNKFKSEKHNERRKPIPEAWLADAQEAQKTQSNNPTSTQQPSHQNIYITSSLSNKMPAASVPVHIAPPITSKIDSREKQTIPKATTPDHTVASRVAASASAIAGVDGSGGGASKWSPRAQLEKLVRRNRDEDEALSAAVETEQGWEGGKFEE